MSSRRPPRSLLTAAPLDGRLALALGVAVGWLRLGFAVSQGAWYWPWMAVHVAACGAFAVGAWRRHRRELAALAAEAAS